MFLFLPLKRCCSKLDNAATHGQVIEMYSVAMDVGRIIRMPPSAVCLYTSGRAGDVHQQPEGREGERGEVKDCPDCYHISYNIALRQVQEISLTGEVEK